MLSNLLKETIERLHNNGKDEKDVLWVGNNDRYTTWKHFKKIANKEYNAGFGSQEVASDLLVVGKDFWLERRQYDGSEWWEFKEIPMQPIIKKQFKSVFGLQWKTLDEIEENMEENKNEKTI